MNIEIKVRGKCAAQRARKTGTCISEAWMILDEKYGGNNNDGDAWSLALGNTTRLRIKHG